MVAVYSHRYLVLGLLVGALLMGLLVTFMTTPQYTSTARIEILPDAPVATSVAGEPDRAVSDEVSFYNTQYSLLQSRSLAERVIRAGNLMSNESFVSAFELDSPTDRKSTRLNSSH